MTDYVTNGRALPPGMDISSLFGGSDYSSLSNWGGPATSMPVEGLGMLGNVAAAPPTWWDSLQGKLDSSGILGKTLADGTKVQGWGGMGLGVANGLMQGFLGMKQYGLMKDQLAQSKKAFDLNYNAQVKTTNAALEDRQAARVAANPNAYQSVGDYMKKNGIGG